VGVSGQWVRFQVVARSRVTAQATAEEILMDLKTYAAVTASMPNVVGWS
jgi:hypothetical protein